MGFWGWRQAAWMAFISVLVVACTESAPVPPPATTTTPRPVTLTMQGSPGAPPATARPTLAAVTATPAKSDPAPVQIMPPNCADMESDGYQCVGLARSLGEAPLGTIILQADLYNRGEIIETHTLAVEQRILAARSAAPYRLLFENDADGPLVLTLVEAYAPDEHLFALEISDALGTMDGSDYTLAAQVRNVAASAVTQVRVIAALYASDRLVGYRTLEFDSLAAGNDADVEVVWHAVEQTADYRYTLTADGIIAGD